MNEVGDADTSEPITVAARRKKVGLGICRFRGCDEYADLTLGTMPLCALHHAHVSTLMDQGACRQDRDAPIPDRVW